MDVLRENIGLLQLPYEDEYYYDEEDINEGFLGFGKKKRGRLESLKHNLGRIGARAAGGLAAHVLFNKAYKHKYGNLKKDTKDYWANGAAIGGGTALGDVLYNKFTGRKLSDTWND